MLIYIDADLCGSESGWDCTL